TGAVDGSPARRCHCPASCTTKVSRSRRVASVAGAIEADVWAATSYPLHDSMRLAKRSPSALTEKGVCSYRPQGLEARANGWNLKCRYMNRTDPGSKGTGSSGLAVPDWIRDYNGEWLKLDALAGLTTAAVVIPKAMAYATIAGLPVQVGLYTAFLPMVIYA